MHQNGYRNLWVDRTTYRWKSFHNHQHAGLVYATGQTYRHRDAVSRIYTGIEEDRFIHADRHLARMMVQCTDEVYEGPVNSTWRRTFIRNMAPYAIRVANWPINTAPIDSKHWSQKDWMIIVLKWPVSCIVLAPTAS